MAGIIKCSGRTHSPSGEASVAYQFDDMGQAYLDRVRAEASKIIADARGEAARIKAKAADEGKQAAMQAVEASLRAKIDQQVQSLVGALKQAVNSITQSRQAWQQQWETHGIHVAIAIANRIIRREIATTPEISLDLIREALQLASGQQRIIIRLNHADHAALAGKAEQIVRELGHVAETQIIADAAISPGGCRVETPYGAIDQQIETQLARITKELLS